MKSAWADTFSTRPPFHPPKCHHHQVLPILSPESLSSLLLVSCTSLPGPLWSVIHAMVVSGRAGACRHLLGKVIEAEPVPWWPSPVTLCPSSLFSPHCHRALFPPRHLPLPASSQSSTPGLSSSQDFARPVPCSGILTPSPGIGSHIVPQGRFLPP